jgi:hypothetical protein
MICVLGGMEWGSGSSSGSRNLYRGMPSQFFLRDACHGVKLYLVNILTDSQNYWLVWIACQTFCPALDLSTMSMMLKNRNQQKGTYNSIRYSQLSFSLGKRKAEIVVLILEDVRDILVCMGGAAEHQGEFRVIVKITENLLQGEGSSQ